MRTSGQGRGRHEATTNREKYQSSGVGVAECRLESPSPRPEIRTTLINPSHNATGNSKRTGRELALLLLRRPGSLVDDPHVFYPCSATEQVQVQLQVQAQVHAMY
ncbi:hypothetical protein CSHISOI_10283 [Colletotrichum shisoi]|uniref:Uncharacterized protein n=1 Tax=Colletotrichum shisoi TaxID=2078593 RepID=A0A5Q4BEL3_9PEZI|nr:hypothetical protein CSHISOI_10283 [Colletotrichum shisoi]